jgi:four helix bundle protein
MRDFSDTAQPKPPELRTRTKRFALQVISLCERLPRTDTARVISRQLLRAGTSPGAQFREAHRAKSTADFVSKMEGALQELDETAYWLELLVEGGIVEEAAISELYTEAQELIAIFVASVRTAKQRSGA